MTGHRAIGPAPGWEIEGKEDIVHLFEEGVETENVGSVSERRGTARKPVFAGRVEGSGVLPAIPSG